MSKMMTHILVFLLLGFMAIGLGDCNDSPVRPKETNTCWKPLDSSITGVSHSFNPAWSPSGKYVAFVGFFDSCNNPSPAIYITERGGKSRRALNILGSVVHWLPPGDSVLIVNEGLFGGGELVKYNIESNIRTPLGIQTRQTFFDVSCDGRFIYYEAEPIPPHLGASIIQHELSTGGEHALVAGSRPSVSPSGLLLAYGLGTLNVYNFLDSSISIINDPALTPDWVNDTLIAFFDDSAREIGIIDLNGNRTKITDGLGGISVSPDGRRILYSKGSPHDGNGHVWIVDLRGGEPNEFIR